MDANVNLNDYAEFVDSVTSKESKQFSDFSKRIAELEAGPHVYFTNLVEEQVLVNDSVNIPRMLTAAIGLASEAGEFAEIVKKIIFQGKPCDADTEWHMKRELGDVIWYWVQGCMALNIDPNEVIKMNIDKLAKRYPGGKFDSWFSENRKDGDL